MAYSTKLFAGMLVASLLLAGAAQAVEPAVGDSPQIQFLATDGTKVDLSKLKGKMVVVDFWATWCGPCMAEAAHMVEINKTYAPQGLQMIGVSLDDDRAKMLTVAKDKGFTWPQFFDGGAWHAKLAEQFSVSSIPFTMLISPEGKVLWFGHPSLLGNVLEKEMKAHPPQLVDPAILAKAQTILSDAEGKLDASDGAGAAKLLASIPPSVKADKETAARIKADETKLGGLADAALDEANSLAQAKKYPEAIAAYRTLTRFPSNLRATAAASAKLRELSSDPEVKAMIAASDKAAEANSALEAAQTLKTQKKDFQAYPQFKQIVTDFAGTSAAAKAARQVATYEADSTFMEKYQDNLSSGKGKGMLSLARNYRKAGQADQAKAKYQQVIDQFPGSSVAKTAATEMAEMASE